MFDARQIANCLLDLAETRGIKLTHLALQKIVYFCHGLAYARFGRPLLLNKIEAWKRGPVVRELYFAFNGYGERSIDGRATLISLGTGKPEIIAYDFSEDVLQHIEEVLDVYGPISAGKLVAMTHERGTPWDRTIAKAQNAANVGMHIDESLIREFFAPALAGKAHKENLM